MMKKITLFMFVAMLFGTANAQTEYAIDYDGYDESESISQGGFTYERGYWTLNTNTDVEYINMQWVIVDFDRLIVTEDFANFQTLPSTGDYTITVDSVLFYYGYQPEKDTINDITFSIYDFDDVARGGVVPNRPNESNPVASATPLYTESITQSDLTISPNFEQYWVYPDLTLAQGQNFSVYMQNESDTLDQFGLMAGGKSSCGAQELYNTSAADFNTSAYMKLNANLEGILNYYTLTAPALDPNCDSWYTQNVVITPFITVTAAGLAVEATSTQITDEAFCPGFTTTLNANAFGGSGNYTYEWSPATGLSSTTGSEVTVTVGEDDVVYTVTVTDTDDNTVLTDDVNVISLDVNITGVNDSVTLACGDVTNINADATTEGSMFGFTIETEAWSGGNVNPLEVSEEGSYTFTAIDNFGCSASESVYVSVEGNNAVDFTVGGTLCPAPAIATNVEVTNTSERTNGWNFTWYVIQAGDTIGQPGGIDFVYQFPATGTYQLSLAADSASCLFSKTRTVTVASGLVPPCGGVNISDVSFNNYSVYPNPASDVLNVSFSLPSNDDVEVSVISVDGKVIETLNFNETSVVNTKINTGAMNNGIYILKIKTENGLSTQKFVVSHK